MRLSFLDICIQGSVSVPASQLPFVHATMNLWLSSLLLLVGLSLCSSTPSPEECKALVTPHATYRPMYGRWTFILGYSDNAVFKEKYRTTKSQWIDFLKPPNGEKDVIIEEVAIHDSTKCKHYSMPIHVVGNSGIGYKFNFTCHYSSLRAPRKCLLYHITSINNNNLMEPTGTPAVKEQLKQWRALYLNCTKKTITAEELAEVKKQAECLGFNREPDFHYNPADGSCPDEPPNPSS